MANVTYLPANPTNGQVFIDASNAKWVYDRELDAWERSGTVETVPVATASITGLFQAADKVMLDGIDETPGGFGIIVDPLAGTPARPDGIVAGDIRIVSESIDINCVQEDGARGLSFSLSPEFLESFCMNQTPSAGLDGKQGKQGEPGPDGNPPFAYRDGPIGEPGQRGVDAAACNLVDVRLNDLPGVTDMPIVSMRIVEDGTGACQLLFTKAKVDVGEGDGNSVVATPLSRGLNYPPDASTCSLTRLANWELLKPAGDETTLDLQLVRLAKNTSNDGRTAINSYPLTSFIDDIVAHYQTKLAALDEQWQKQIKDHIIDKDTAARTILSELADQLAQCEFKIPAEFCLDIEKCQANPADQVRPYVAPKPKNRPCCCSDAASEDAQGFGLYVGQGYGGGTAPEYVESRTPAAIQKVQLEQDLGPIWPVWDTEEFGNKIWLRISAKDAVFCGGTGGRQTGMAFQCFHIARPTRVLMEMRGAVAGNNAANVNLGAIKIVGCDSLFQGDKPLPEITTPFVSESTGVNITGLTNANLRRFLLAWTNCTNDDTGSIPLHTLYSTQGPLGFPGVAQICDIYRHEHGAGGSCVTFPRYKKEATILGPGNYMLVYFADWNAFDDMNDSFWSFHTSITSWGCA